MTVEKLREVVGIYRTFFAERGISSVKAPEGEKIYSPDLHLRHCHAMLDGIEGFITEGRVEKAMRWLGFVQGVLWASGLFTLDDLKTHSRPSL